MIEMSYFNHIYDIDHLLRVPCIKMILELSDFWQKIILPQPCSLSLATTGQTEHFRVTTRVTTRVGIGIIEAPIHVRELQSYFSKLQLRDRKTYFIFKTRNRFCWNSHARTINLSSNFFSNLQIIKSLVNLFHHPAFIRRLHSGRDHFFLPAWNLQ